MDGSHGASDSIQSAGSAFCLLCSTLGASTLAFASCTAYGAQGAASQLCRGASTSAKVL